MNRDEQIISESELFNGELVDKPMTGLVVGIDADGDDIFACPKCKQPQTVMQASICGNEPGAVFCWKCNQEFYLG